MIFQEFEHLLPEGTLSVLRDPQRDPFEIPIAPLDAEAQIPGILGERRWGTILRILFVGGILASGDNVLRAVSGQELNQPFKLPHVLAIPYGEQLKVLPNNNVDGSIVSLTNNAFQGNVEDDDIFSLSEEQRRANEVIAKMTEPGNVPPPEFLEEHYDISATEFYIIKTGEGKYTITLGGSGTEVDSGLTIIGNGRASDKFVTEYTNAKGQKVRHVCYIEDPCYTP